MGVQSFFKQRRPRQFEHKLIYWDPRREELQKRVARVRQELVASGELSAEEAQRRTAAEEALPTGADRMLPDSAEHYDPSSQVRGSFMRSTQHLQRQHERGLTAADRDRRTIRLMLGLLLLGFAFWYFFLR